MIFYEEISSIGDVNIWLHFLPSMVSIRFSLREQGRFLSSLPWISPLDYVKSSSPNPDVPTEISIVPRRKSRFISHELLVYRIKKETDPQRALDVFNMASEQRGFCHNNSTYAIILHKLAQSKKFRAVEGILRQMTLETCRFQEGIFLNLMNHFSKSSLHEKTFEMFLAIGPLVREKPSLKALSTCLNLLIESNQIDLAKKLLAISKKDFHMKPNTCIFNILVKYHCNNGEMESAFELLHQMKSSKFSFPNVITYSTLMGGLCNEGRMKEAFELFEEMVSKDNIFPDSLTYNILINGFCKCGRVDKAKKVIEFMKINGCNPNLYNYSALMNGFSREGKLDEAKIIFEEMRQNGLADKVSYTTMISCLCRLGKVDQAIELAKEMKKRECKADPITFNVIISALCREKRLEEAIGMIESLPYDGLHLNKSSYRIVLNFLCREGELDRAVDLLGLMLERRLLPHFATSNELLVGLCNADKITDATMVLYGLSEMGFKPEANSWLRMVESVCRERKMPKVFDLLNNLVFL